MCTFLYKQIIYQVGQLFIPLFFQTLMLSHFGIFFGWLKRKIVGENGDEKECKKVMGKTALKRFFYLCILLHI